MTNPTATPRLRAAAQHMVNRLSRIAGHPLTLLLVLLAGVTANTVVQIHYGHLEAVTNAAQVERINGQTLARARRLFKLRQYSDDGIKDIDGILRSHSPEHPGVVLPPPLPPEPNYDADPSADPHP